MANWETKPERTNTDETEDNTTTNEPEPKLGHQPVVPTVATQKDSCTRSERNWTLSTLSPPYSFGQFVTTPNRKKQKTSFRNNVLSALLCFNALLCSRSTKPQPNSNNFPFPLHSSFPSVVYNVQWIRSPCARGKAKNASVFVWLREWLFQSNMAHRRSFGFGNFTQNDYGARACVRDIFCKYIHLSEGIHICLTAMRMCLCVCFALQPKKEIDM